MISPKLPAGKSQYDNDKVEEFYNNILTDGSIDSEENAELIDFFSQNMPPKESLVTLRATAFKVAANHLSENKSKNVALLRSINVIIHCFESTCLRYESTSIS